MIKVHVPITHNSYDIIVGEGIMEKASKFLSDRKYGQVVIVSDDNIWPIHGNTMVESLKGEDIPFSLFMVPAGEGSKNLSMLGSLYKHFSHVKLDREGLIIAFGGGVIGDLSGFAAATWMGGTDYIQIPTTLLAQIDSSVGGKTAVNLKYGKNLVGAFYQPKLVVSDISFLETLPPREIGCGMAEMIKYAAIFSRELMDKFMCPLSKANLPKLIATCCILKSRVVVEDEKDKGRRMLLNFGHTFGHALESLGHYEKYNHGEAVAIGMVIAAAYGEKTGLTQKGCRDYIKTVLSKHGLDTQCPYTSSQVFEAMTFDKKSKGDSIDLILLKDIGEAAIVNQSLESIKDTLSEVI